MMVTLNIILLIIIVFVLIMHYKQDWYNSFTKWLHIRTKYLRPEVSVVELIILIMTALIVFKLYF